MFFETARCGSPDAALSGPLSPMKKPPSLTHLSHFFFSQPLLSSQSLLTQTQSQQHANNGCQQPFDSAWCLTQGPLQKMVCRMTRFCVTVSADDALSLITKVLEENGFQTKFPFSYQVVASMLGPKNNMGIIVNVYDMFDDGHPKVLVDFRRSNGDGLAFKRWFTNIRRLLHGVITPSGGQWMKDHGLVSGPDQQADGIRRRLNVSSPPLSQEGEDDDG